MNPSMCYPAKVKSWIFRTSRQSCMDEAAITTHRELKVHQES